jgi:hypothetical protein
MSFTRASSYLLDDSESEEQVSQSNSLQTSVFCENVRRKKGLFDLMDQSRVLWNQKSFRTHALLKCNRKRFSLLLGKTTDQNHPLPFLYHLPFFNVSIPYNKKSKTLITSLKKTKYAVLVHTSDVYFDTSSVGHRRLQHLLIGMDLIFFRQRKYVASIFLYFTGKPKIVNLQLCHRKGNAFVPVYDKTNKMPIETILYFED